MDNSFVLDPNQIRSYKATAAIVEGNIVKLSTATAPYDGEACEKAAAATDIAVGVAYRAQATAGRSVDIVFGGQCRVLLGGTVTKGAQLVSDASGRAVAVTPGNTTVNYRVGFALEGGVINEYCAIQVSPCVVLI